MIVDAAMGLARSYGITTVAEGVELPEQEKTLNQLGCEYAQGFSYRRPSPPSVIEALLASRSDGCLSGGAPSVTARE